MESSPTTKQTVLFLCTANSARSQIAEALLRDLAGERFEMHSAGTEPKEVHTLTRVVLAEVGIDASAQRSKHVDQFLGKAKIDHVVIVCERAQRACPSIYPFAYRVHLWPFPDPAAGGGSRSEALERFRAVRDALAARLREWLQEPSNRPEARGAKRN